MRTILIKAGPVSIRARLLDTPTAERVWRTLPIHSTAETWGGGAIHFKTNAESYRERGAKMLVKPGEIAFTPEHDWITIGFGPTPISKKGEIRLSCPSNIWAVALDDVTALAAVRAGEEVLVVAG